MTIEPAATDHVALGLPVATGEWCTWQHATFWLLRIGFESWLPSLALVSGEGREYADPMNPNQGILREIAQAWKRFMVIGVLLLLLGIVAIVVPHLASLVSTIFVGWILIFAGLFLVAVAFSRSGAWQVIGALVWGLLTAGVGIYIALANPARGVLALTLVLCIYFIVVGTTRIWLAFAERGTPGAGLVGVNGVLSLIIGILILAELPESSLWAIGLLVGIDLIFAGWSFVATGLAGRDLARRAT